MVDPTPPPALTTIPTDGPLYYAGIERYVSPWQDVAAVILKHVDRAQRELLMIVYSFTLGALADLVLAKADAGLVVRCIMDRSQSIGKAQQPVVDRLFADPRIDLVIGVSPDGGIIHEKGICCDREKLIQGSYNFSAGAPKQVNHLDVHHGPAVATTFVLVFDTLYPIVRAQHQPAHAVYPPGSPAPAAS